jgi:hypothetical protein
MDRDQIIMGLVIAALCGLGFYHTGWMLERTGKGRALVGWLGATGAGLAWRGLMLMGAIFGILLAADVIRPLRWSLW